MPDDPTPAAPHDGDARIVSPHYEHEAIAEWAMIPRVEYERLRADAQRADAQRDRLVRFIAVDLYEIGHDRDEAGWWHDQVALALGRIVLEFPIGTAGE